MSERRLRLRKRGAAAPVEMRVTLASSERAGRWITRLSAPEAPETTAGEDEWPGLPGPGQTQRVFVGPSEAEALRAATDWLRVHYEVTEER